MNYLRRITGPAALIALAVLWSNIWGQLKEGLSYSFFDKGAVAAYGAALKVPFEAPQIISNAMAAAMVPVLVGLYRRGHLGDARRLSTGIIGAIVCLLTPLALIGMADPQPVLRLFWPANAVVMAMAIHLSRVLFPYLLISGVAGAMAATLQSFEEFRPLALGQLVPNVVIVASMLVLHQRLGVTSQAVGVVLGGAAYLALLFPYLLRLFRRNSETDESTALPEAWWRMPAAHQIGRAMLPLILIGLADWGASQAIVFHWVFKVGVGDEAAFSEFAPAFKILQIPQGIFLAALVTVLLPVLSRFAAFDDMDGLASEASAGIRMVLYVVAPTAIALGCLALPVLNVLYRHGQLAQTPGAVETAVPLVGLMASCILFSSVGEVLILCLLALKRVWSLLVVQALSLAASVGLCWQMTKWLGLPGLAGAVSLTALVTLGLLFGMVERYIKIHDWQEMGQFAWKTFLACVVVWAWLHFLAGIVASRGGVSGVFPNAAEIAVGVVISAMLYIAVSERLRIPEWLAARAVVERVVQRHNVDEAFRSAED